MGLVFDHKLVSSVTAFVNTLYRRSPIRGLDPEDVVQDVLERLWRSADRYDPVQSPSASAWVFMIAKNRFLDLARSRQRRHTREAGKVDAAALPDRAMRPDAVVAQHEEIGHVQRALDALPELEREVLVARASDGDDLRDLAVGTGLSYKRTVYLSGAAAAGVRRAVDLATRPPPECRLPMSERDRARRSLVSEGRQMVWTFRFPPQRVARAQERRRARRQRVARAVWEQQRLPWAA